MKATTLTTATEQVNENVRRNGHQTEVRLLSILKSKVALRDVNRNTEKYVGLVESIRTNGVFLPILVRETVNEFGKPAFGLVDGLQRFTAAGDAGLDWIPANIKNMEEGEVLDAQLITNLHKIETKPVEYTKHLLRILSANPLMSEKELASRLSMTETYIRQRLSLNKLKEPIAKLVDDGKINLMNGYALARLSEEDQVEFVDRAMTDDPKVFVPTVNQRLKQVRDAARAGKDTTVSAVFTPVPHLQKVGEIKAEWENSSVAASLLDTVGAKSALDGWKAAMAWVLNMDPVNVEKQRVRDEERRKKRDADKELAKLEREKKKEEAAQAAAADILKL